MTKAVDTSAVDWPGKVVGDRATLVSFGNQSVESDWLEEAARAIGGRGEPCVIHDRLADGDHGWWILGDGQPVGAVCGRLATARGATHTATADSRALIWTWLAIDVRWRAYGYGGAAVPLLETAARLVGASRALAPLPVDNGVALYFWLRLGYTPIRLVDVEPSDWPAGVSVDALWMQRPLAPPALIANEGVIHADRAAR